MDTVSETVSKVDEGLQEMGIDGVKDSLKDLLNFKQYMENQVPAVMGFCIKVVLSVIVFFVGRKIIQWILNVMRRCSMVTLSPGRIRIKFIRSFPLI